MNNFTGLKTSRAELGITQNELSISKNRILDETNTMPQELLVQLADESLTAIYVADYETDELLYLNSTSKKVLHTQGNIQTGQKCYEYLMHRDTPCPFCHKVMFCEDAFRENVIKFPFNGRQYKINSKIITWGGRKVHIHYITDVTELLDKEKELRTLTDKIPTGIGIFYAYTDGKVEHVYLNDGFYKMLGTAMKDQVELSGFAILDYVHPQDLKILREKLKESVETNTQLNVVIRVVKENNQYVWLKLCGDIAERTPQKCIFYCVFTDIDELKEKQATVDKLLMESRASEAKFKSIMAHVPGAMVVFEVKNKLLWLKYISDSCKAITGFTAEETYARSGPDPLADAQPDSREFFRQNEWEDIQKGVALSYKYQLVCKDGTYKWVSLNLSPVEENGKRFYYGLLRDLDMDEKTYVIKANRYNQLLTFMENSDEDNLLVKGCYNIAQNKCLYFQKKGEKQIRMPEDITFEEAREELLQTVDLAEHCRELLAVLNQTKLMREYTEGRAEGELEYKRKEKSGGYFWSSLKYNLCMNPDTKDVMLFIFIYDITQRILEKNMLNMLGATEYEVLGSIDVRTHYYETRGVGSVYDVQEKKVDYPSGHYETVWFKRIRTYVPQEEQETLLEQMAIDNIRKQLEKSKNYFLTYSVRESDGKYHRKKMQYCYLDNSRETIFYFRSDITETYEREQCQLRNTEDALAIARDANSAKTDFFARMSHDMRTPMNGILGLAGLAENETNPAVLQEYLGKIRESGEYLLSLINDTLDFERIESGKLKLEPKPVYCRTIVQNIIDMIKPSAEKKNISFRVSKGNVNLDCYLMLDSIRIRQIFMNLLSNAIKFTLEGGTISGECQCLKRENGKVYDVFKISDTGIGMSEEFLQNHIFQPFSQEPSELSAKYAGSGLGLSIVHSLVEMMGGTIEVESEPGSGTTFTICLNFDTVDASEISAIKEDSRQSNQNVLRRLKGIKVLLAEDHPLNAEITKRLLEKVGCIITWTKDGQECVDTFEQAEQGQFDVILMDIRMPRLNGLDAARKIRSLNRMDAGTIPILAMTANAYDEDVRMSNAAGMNGHLSKPIIPELLYETIAGSIPSRAMEV